MNDITRFMDEKGRIKTWAAKKENKFEILKYISTKFENGRFYLEKETLILQVKHAFDLCGSESDLEYVLPADDWEKNIASFQTLIRNGWNMPPLIAYNEIDKLIVNDGNHRLEAMRREGVDKCWVIIWESDSPENLQYWTRCL